MCDCAKEKERLFQSQKAEKIKQEQEGLKLDEEVRGKPEQKRRREEARSCGDDRYTKKQILGMSALVFLLLCLLFRSLGRRRARKILAVFGLGWLIPRNPYCDPSPTINQDKLKWPSSDVCTFDQNACCTCDDE